jgi:protein involved in polysaccharide export with SLBB domain
VDFVRRSSVLKSRVLALLGVLWFALAWVPLAEAQSSSEPAAAPAASAAGAPATDAQNDYVLGSGDVIRVIVFGEENLSGQFTVAGNGILSFPLIGDLPAAGKTVETVRDEIADALRDGYVKDPKVSAEVTTFRPYFMLGEVARPGQYPYSNHITVMNAIATAGGFTYRANQKFAFIKPSDGAEEHKVRLNDQLMLAPGDTVRIAERYF